MISQDRSRTEHDSFGDIEVPGGALWGAQTERARRNFQLSGTTLPADFIAALALIKAAAARANQKLGLIPADLADAIVNAALAVSRGAHDAQFPLDVYQTGSGTSTNMNMNEVIASLAGQALGRAVHANDHVNMCQSSNDCIPSTIHVSAVLASRRELLPALEELRSALADKEQAWQTILKTGRTHLMDATPMSLGQEVSGWRAQIELSIERLRGSEARLLALAQGGTAIGTGINAHEKFATTCIEELNALTALAFRAARNHFAAQGTQEAVVLEGRHRSSGGKGYLGASAPRANISWKPRLRWLSRAFSNAALASSCSRYCSRFSVARPPIWPVSRSSSQPPNRSGCRVSWT